MRMFVILAVDKNGKWRAREIKAASYVEAVAAYNKHSWDYEVKGIALLGGSGHEIHWLNEERME